MKKTFLFLTLLFSVFGYPQCECPSIDYENLTETNIQFLSECPIEITNLNWENPLISDISALITHFYNDESFYYVTLTPESGEFNIKEGFWFEFNNQICYYSTLNIPTYEFTTNSVYDVYTLDFKYIGKFDYKNIFNLPKEIYILMNNKQTFKIYKLH